MYYVFEGQNNNASYVKSEYVSEKNKDKGIFVDELPPKENNGKIAILKCDKKLDTVWWEYEDSQDSKPTNEIEQLRIEMSELREQNNHLVETLDMVLTDLIPSLLEGGEPV